MQMQVFEEPPFDLDAAGWQQYLSRREEFLDVARDELDQDAQQEAAATHHVIEARKRLEERDNDVILFYGSFLRRGDAITLALEMASVPALRLALERNTAWSAPPDTLAAAEARLVAHLRFAGY